jgi:hypothetical protein
MHAGAGGAGHGFVRFGLRLARILRDPALHVQTGVRTAKDESNRHDPAIKAGASVTTLIQRKCCFDDLRRISRMRDKSAMRFCERSKDRAMLSATTLTEIGRGRPAEQYP